MVYGINFFPDCPNYFRSNLHVIFDDANNKGFNATGNVECVNSGALFSNNMSIPGDVRCTVTAEWNMKNDVECYTGKHKFVFYTFKIISAPTYL